MKIIIDIMPWWGWVIVGILCIPYMLIWIVSSTKKDPVLLRIAWVFLVIMVFFIAIENMIKGTGQFVEYLPILNKLSMFSLVVMLITLFIGDFQKMLRPDYDPNMRRIGLLLTFGYIIMFLLSMLLIYCR